MSVLAEAPELAWLVEGVQGKYGIRPIDRA